MLPDDAREVTMQQVSQRARACREKQQRKDVAT